MLLNVPDLHRMSGFDRRQASRAIVSGFVEVITQSGPSSGTVYVGVLRDVSDGGICVRLDVDCGLVRGTKVELAFIDAPSLCAWVCRNTRTGETSWSLGMAFNPAHAETPAQQAGGTAAGCAPSEGEQGHQSCSLELPACMHHRRVDESLSLQLWQEADADQAFQVVKDSHSDLEQWVEWATQVHTADVLRGFIRYSLQQHRLGKTWQFAIRQQGRIAGGVGLVVRSDDVGEIGYWLGSAYQGQGIATRCAREAMALGFETLGFQCVELRCAITNERSRGVAERLGFVLDSIVPRGHWTLAGMEDLMVYRMDRYDAIDANLQRTQGGLVDHGRSGADIDSEATRILAPRD